VRRSSPPLQLRSRSKSLFIIIPARFAAKITPPTATLAPTARRPRRWSLALLEYHCSRFGYLCVGLLFKGERERSTRGGEGAEGTGMKEWVGGRGKELHVHVVMTTSGTWKKGNSLSDHCICIQVYKCSLYISFNLYFPSLHLSMHLSPPFGLEFSLNPKP
jgi:hypothetical protein